MRRSDGLPAGLTPKQERLRFFDRAEIDHPQAKRASRLNYLDRVQLLRGKVRQFLGSASEAKTVVELGCCQGNLSLLLAEDGFHVIAVDVEPEFLAYGKLKQESGRIDWVQAEAGAWQPESPVDAVVMGEVVEHCAYPEDALASAAKMLKPGGLLLVTTPNGPRLGAGLPSFKAMGDREARKALEARQFGPEGDDHLFLFTLEELVDVAPEGCTVLESGYCGGGLFYTKWVQPLTFAMAPDTVAKILRGLAQTPVINRLFCHNLYMVLQKKAAA